jgi:hypothetical protein
MVGNPDSEMPVIWRTIAITLKCMVRRLTARGLKLSEATVCVNVSGLLVEIVLRALDDDPHVSVLLKPLGH